MNWYCYCYRRVLLHMEALFVVSPTSCIAAGCNIANIIIDVGDDNDNGVLLLDYLFYV